MLNGGECNLFGDTLMVVRQKGYNAVFSKVSFLLISILLLTLSNSAEAQLVCPYATYDAGGVCLPTCPPHRYLQPATGECLPYPTPYNNPNPIYWNPIAGGAGSFLYWCGLNHHSDINGYCSLDPPCGTGMFFSEIALECESIPDCAKGTLWNEDTFDCECPNGQKWNGKECVIDSCPITSYLDGQETGDYCLPFCPPEAYPRWPSCSPMIVCNPDQVWNPYLPTCEPGEYCSNPNQYKDPKSGRCFPLPKCPAGHFFNSFLFKCESIPNCEPGTSWNSKLLVCQCPSGKHWDGKVCSLDAAPTCSNGFIAVHFPHNKGTLCCPQDYRNINDCIDLPGTPRPRKR
jgi:hypothetical protein